jgi:formate hydrogenlyase subunit 4
MPVDDPTTHLELTMVHEVMTLDHSGPDLAALQFASAAKLTIGLGVIATLLNPVARGEGQVLAMATNVALVLLLAIVVGTVESLIARLKLLRVPQLIGVALVAGAVALLATTWRRG